MKKVALITTNKIFAQSLAAAIEDVEDASFQFFILLDEKQVLIDAEIFEIDIALIDLRDRSTDEKEMLLSFCKSLHERLPVCKIMLLVSQDNPVGREIAIQAKKKEIIEDFIFYDSSLKYLLAKLSAL